jgi:branched-chain amino acid transport system permease protein
VNWINAALQGVLLGGEYALVACGLSLTFGVMRLVNIAHGDFAVCGAYLALVLSSWFGVPAWYTLPLLLPVAFGIGMALQTLVLWSRSGPPSSSRTCCWSARAPTPGRWRAAR